MSELKVTPIPLNIAGISSLLDQKLAPINAALKNITARLDALEKAVADMQSKRKSP